MRGAVYLGGVLGSALLTCAGCVAAGDDGAASKANEQAATVAVSAPVKASPPVVPAEPIRTDFSLNGRIEQGGLVVGRAPTGAASVRFNGEAMPVTPDGYFLIGFDRDAGTTARLTATRADGGEIAKALTIAPSAWRLEHVNTPYRGSASSDADYQRRRAGELAQINAARRMVVASDGWRQHFIWPVKGRISGYFGSQRVYQGKPGSYHSGTDIAVPTGTPFVAPADGVVILAAETPFTLEGRLLMIDHGNGLNSAFLHCSRLDVKTGDVVRQGQQLGLVGATGRASGPHLHWAAKWRAARVDTLKLAGDM